MLSGIQKTILWLLKAYRSTDVFVAGGAALNRSTPRRSDDLDMFGKTPDAVVTSAHTDITVLRKHGYAIDVLKDLPGWVEVVASKDGAETLMQWIWDDEYHFLPVQEDPEFGFVFHHADLAVNKVTAAFGRRAARDYIDLVLIDESYAPLGAFLWAAPGKVRRADLSPGEVIDEIRRRAAAHPRDKYAQVKMADGADPVAIAARLNAILDRAEDYVMNQAPSEHWGCLFLTPDGLPVSATADMIADGRAAPVQASESGVWPRFEDPVWNPPSP